MEGELSPLKTKYSQKKSQHKSVGSANPSVMIEPHENLILRARTFFENVCRGTNTMNFDLNHEPPAFALKGQAVISANAKLFYSPDDKYLVVISSTLPPECTVVKTESWSVMNKIELEDTQNALTCIWFLDSKHFAIVTEEVFSVFKPEKKPALQTLKINEFRDLGKMTHSRQANIVPQEYKSTDQLSSGNAEILFSKSFRMNCIQSAAEFVIGSDYIPTEIPDLTKCTYSRLVDTSAQFMLFGTSQYLYLIDLIDWDDTQPLQNRGYRFLPTNYEEIVADQWFVIDPLTIVSINPRGLQFNQKLLSNYEI